MQDGSSMAILSKTGDASITVFVCANCARGGLRPSSTGYRPVRSEFDWPFAAKEVMVSCTGKLQPEHLLKPFEAGSDAVCVIACKEDNCHHLEGSRRIRRRVEYVGRLLDEIALGGGRVMLFNLPGSAHEDLAVGAAEDAGGGAPTPPEMLDEQLRTVREKIVARVESLTPNPLRDTQMPTKSTRTPTELDSTDDSDNEVG